jgi:hypothetical protein
VTYGIPKYRAIIISLIIGLFLTGIDVGMAAITTHLFLWLGIYTTDFYKLALFLLAGSLMLQTAMRYYWDFYTTKNAPAGRVFAKDSLF